MTYQPQPGTIPHRVVEHLRSIPAGTWLSTAAVTEAIGLDGGNIAAYCAPAVSAGLLRTRRQEGARYLMWALGDGIAIAVPEEDDDQVELRPRMRDKPAPIPSFVAPKPEVVEEAVPHPPEPELPGVDIDRVHRSPASAQPDPVAIKRAVDAELAHLRPGPIVWVPAPPMPARWGIFNDGSFVIERGLQGQQRVVLDRSELEALLAFLDRMTGAES